jgi:hypothetical protein
MEEQKAHINLVKHTRMFEMDLLRKGEALNFRKNNEI